MRTGRPREQRHCVTCQQSCYTTVAPFGDGLLAVAHIALPDRVPDVGRGCGATTLRLATGWIS
jgi:hypothetical protein